MRPRRGRPTVPGPGPQRETARSVRVVAPAFRKKEGDRAVSATTATTKVYAGVDVSKGRLEVFVAPTGERFSVPNDDSGVDELLARLDEPSSPALVVLEATGGFERPVAAALAASGLAAVAVVNPRQEA